MVRKKRPLACDGCESTEDWGKSNDRAFTVCKNCGLCLPSDYDTVDYDTEYLRQSAPIDKEKDTLYWGLTHTQRRHWTK